MHRRMFLNSRAFYLLIMQALSLRELRILLRRWSRINFLIIFHYISWKNTKGLLQWTFNHISPSTALQHFQGRLSIQEDQKFFDIDLIFVYKGNPLLHFFVNKKSSGAKSNLISTSYSNVPASKRRTRILLTTFLVKCNQVPGYSKCLWIWILILFHFPISLDVEQQQKPGLARSVLDAAYADSGLALDFYTGFDANWNEPAWPVQGFDVLWSLYKKTRWTTQIFKIGGFGLCRFPTF